MIIAVITTTAIAVAAVVASLAAAGVSAYSAHQQGQAQKKAAKYNQQVADNNARLANMQASFDAQRVRDRNRRLAATQRANFAKSGVSIVSGSAFLAQQDQELQGELDALSTLYRGKVEATGQQSQSEYYKMVGSNAQAQANINIAGSLLGGASNAAVPAANLVEVEV